MRYHNITKDDMLNGDGLRVVLWVAGCSRACKGCQNPLTWDSNGGVAFDDAAKQELYQELGKDYISGITFSGGDPLHSKNVREVTELAKEIRQLFPEKTIWLYTGASWEGIKDMELTSYLNVLIDGEYEVDKHDAALCWKGSSNQRVIDVKKKYTGRKGGTSCVEWHDFTK